MISLDTYIDNTAYASIASVREAKQTFEQAKEAGDDCLDEKLAYARRILNVKLHKHYQDEPLETSWRGFAESVLDVHPDYATRLAKWAYVYEVLMAGTGSAPSTPYTARPFAKLSPTDMIQAWTDLREDVGQDDISYNKARDYIHDM